MTTSWLDELDAAAERATPGPWAWIRYILAADSDKNYVAACSPERIRALIACVRAAKVVSEENMCMSTPGLVAFDAAYAELEKL